MKHENIRNLLARAFSKRNYSSPDDRETAIEIPSVDHWYALTAKYPEFRRPGNRTLKDYGYMKIYEYLDSHPELKSILEFGHGFNVSLFQRYGNERDTWGADAFQDLHYFPRREEWHQRMQEMVASAPPSCKFRTGLLGTESAKELPLNYFDVICSVSVLEEMELEQVRPILEHCEKLLKPGGVLIGTHDFYDAHAQDRLSRYCEMQREVGLHIKACPKFSIDTYTLVESPAQARVGLMSA